MKRVIRVRICVLGMALMLGLMGGARGAMVYPSENGKYSVELSQGDSAMEIVVSVSRVEEEGSTLLWSRRREWPNPYGFPSWFMGRAEGLVSNDGKTAIVRDGDAFWVGETRQNGVAMLQAEGENKLSMEEIEELLGVDEVSERLFFTLSHSESGAAIMDFIWEQKGWYCAFFPEAKEWLVIGLEDLKGRRASKIEKELLQVEGRRRALKLVEEHQPGVVKSLLKELRNKAAGYLPGIGKSPPAYFTWNKAAPAYELLGAQRHPEDKIWLEKLLNGVGDDLAMANGFYQAESTTFLLHSPQRALADGLLSEWEGIERDEIWMDFEPWETDGRLNFLGAVRGEVRLPVLTSTNAGTLVVCLIPAELEKGNWENRTSVIRMNGYLNGNIPGMAGRPGQLVGVGVEKIRFIFSTIPPGKYRLKAIWDKRPPHEAGSAGGGASPGDYESAETKSFTVEAGEVLTGAVLECTNRVGAAEGFYAEDASWDQQARAEAVRTEMMEFRKGLEESPRKTLFEAPLEKWIVKKGVRVRSGPRLMKVMLVEGNAEEGEGPEVLQVSFWGGSEPNLTAEIIDEHGCKFPGLSVGSRLQPSGRAKHVRFSIFPRAGEFRLEVTSYNQKALGNWTLTNAAPARLNAFEPEALPIRRAVEDAVVELRGIHRVTGAEIALAQGETEWELKKLDYLDQEGNQADRLDSLCERLDRVKVRVELHRRLRHEFPAERKWTLAMDGYPARGEYHNLGVSHEVQGVQFHLLAISGQGEFTYEGARVIEAEPEFNRYAPRVNWRGNSGSVFVKTEPSGSLAFDPTEKHTVVSRVPHLGLEVEGLRAGQVWALLEERVPVYHQPRGADEHRMRFYLPINRPKLTEIKRLTFIVFEPRTVEFVAEVPGSH